MKGDAVSVRSGDGGEGADGKGSIGVGVEGRGRGGGRRRRDEVSSIADAQNAFNGRRCEEAVCFEIVNEAIIAGGGIVESHTLRHKTGSGGRRGGGARR